MNIKEVIGSIVETIIKVAALLFLISFVYDAAIKAYDFGFRVFAEEAMTTGDGRTISISVEQDDTVMDIGKNLQEKGLIRDANLFFVQELLSENHGKINPGIYDLNTSMKSDEMLAIMAAEPEEEKKKEAENSGKADSEEEEDQDAGDAEENGAEGEAE
ncbi:MAG: endolytic transglycosylase MltG [Lachnospiraceae bacterium]|nr:endolytic transglycosylase MltG [Lachnospiraceae bacterium]